MKLSDLITRKIKILLFSLAATLLLFITSCHDSAQEMVKAQVSFSVTSVKVSSSSGRTEETITPAAVIVSIHDANGKVIQDHYRIPLTAFGDEFISQPILIDVTDQQNFFLSEFLVLDNNETTVYATPREGSDLAHLVKDPLDIAFNVTSDEVTTVIPEVLAVENTSPQEFGYADFGFNVVNKIEAVFSTFIQGTDGDQLTNAHLKVEGLQDSTSSAPAVLWSYETDLLAKANIVALKESPAYRITITKDGYDNWQKVRGLKQATNVSVTLTKPTMIDVYRAGHLGDTLFNHYAVYFKNGVPYELDKSRSAAVDIAVHNNDVYTAGYRTSDAYGHYFKYAGYWKNTTRIDFSFYGSTQRIAFSGDDLYIAGVSQPTSSYTDVTTGFYMKNGVKTDLPSLTPGASVTIKDMFVDGSDVYIIGTETKNNVTNQLYWKNATVTTLDSFFRVEGIAVRNGHVYISGNERGLGPVYMKDNQMMPPLFSPSAATATDIVVTDQEDIFILDTHGGLWINGNYSKLLNEGTSPITTRSIAVLGYHFYVTGEGYSPLMSQLPPPQPLVSTYWSNGIAQWPIGMVGTTCFAVTAVSH